MYCYKIGTHLDHYIAIKNAAVCLCVITNYITVCHFKACKNEEGRRKTKKKKDEEKKEKREIRKKPEKIKRTVKRVKEKA